MGEVRADRCDRERRDRRRGFRPRLLMNSKPIRVGAKDCANTAAPETLDGLLKEVRACRVCAAYLPLGPRPVLQAGAAARILIVGQAPGAKVHASGIPWSDKSGERLRSWMGIDTSTFYDERKVAIMPMGFCYPGRAASGDLPPRRECAPLWHARLLARMPRIELTLLVGAYAQAHFLRDVGHLSVTATTRDWRAHAPRIIPLPHPSPRNVAWFLRNPWFEAELLPNLRCQVRKALRRKEIVRDRKPRISPHSSRSS